MATISATAATTLLAPRHRSFGSAPTSTVVLGLPKMGSRAGRVRCAAEGKAETAKISAGAASVMAAVAAAATSPAAMALVDDRMSTEGTGLPFGLSNGLLGWIMLGMFGLIWALYFSYTGSLEEDEDSGLSL